MSDQIERYMANLTHWFIVCNPHVVNLEDLLSMRPGQIVRNVGAAGDLQVHIVPPCETLGCIAGFISEDE